jgi:SAM-dependent methyltransferase
LPAGVKGLSVIWECRNSQWKGCASPPSGSIGGNRIDVWCERGKTLFVLAVCLGTIALAGLGRLSDISVCGLSVPVLARQPARTPDIYFAPTRHVVADQMLALARVNRDDVVFDLGSGDGRLIILAAQKYGARGVGVELDPRLVAISLQVAREGEVADRVKFIEGDLFTADISAATVVVLYLSPGVNRRLEPKLRKELRPGTRIVSHQFPIGHWVPDETVRAEDGTDLFLWTIPAR